MWSFFSFFLGINTHPPPAWTRASSFTRFLDHTQQRTVVGRTPLDRWSARCRHLYLTIHDTHNREAYIPLVVFKPTISAGERLRTLDRTSTETGFGVELHVINMRKAESDPFHSPTLTQTSTSLKTYIANVGFPGFTSSRFSSVLPHKLHSKVTSSRHRDAERAVTHVNITFWWVTYMDPSGLKGALHKSTNTDWL